jgi:hypothetical protein
MTACRAICSLQCPAIGNNLVVTYVLHHEGAQIETDGPGLGYVNVYKSTGQLLLRLEHGDWFDAP